jgi:PD-(D/E)XK nuclease superfamily
MTLTLSHSKTQTFRRCPHKYKYKYVDRIEKKAKALPLYRGSWIHALLETHYEGGSWEDTHQEQTVEFAQMCSVVPEAQRKDLPDTLPQDIARLMRAYLKHYRNDKFKVLETELDAEIDLPNGDTFRIIIDLIIEEPDGSQWIWDHKTVGSFMDEGFLMIDAQLARYLWGARKLGFSPQGIVFNEVITKAPTVPELLKSGQLTQRKDLFTDEDTYREAIATHGLNEQDYIDTLKRLRLTQGARFFRRTTLPKGPTLVKNMMRDLMITATEIHAAEAKQRFPRSIDKDCAWCEFRDVCQSQLMGHDASDIIRLNYDSKGAR